MFFTMTATIGAALAAAAWSAGDGATVTVPAAASLLMVRIDRRGQAIALRASMETASADLPRLRRPRIVRLTLDGLDGRTDQLDHAADWKQSSAVLMHGRKAAPLTVG